MFSQDPEGDLIVTANVIMKRKEEEDHSWENIKDPSRGGPRHEKQQESNQMLEHPIVFFITII